MPFDLIKSIKTIPNSNKSKIIEGMGVCILGMGDCGSSAKSNINIQNDVLQVDKNSIKLMQDQVNSLIVNEVNKQSQQCSGGVYNSNQVEVVNTNFINDFNFNSDQTNEAYVSFSCVNSANVVSNVSRNMISSLMADLQTNSNQSAIAKMAAVASSEQTQGFGSILNPPSDSEANINFKNTYNQLHETNKQIINKVANTLQKNFSSDVVANCIASISNTNGVVIKGVTAKNANIMIKQKNAATLIAQCIQNSGISTKITDSLTNAFGIKTVDSGTQGASTDGNASATSKSENRGFFESLYSIFGSTGGIIGCIAVCCIICIISIVVLFIARSGGMGRGGRVKSIGRNKMISNLMEQRGTELLNNMEGGEVNDITGIGEEGFLNIVYNFIKSFVTK